MAEDFVYKPSTRKGPVFLAKFKESEPPKIRLPDGRIVEGVPGDQRGGVFLGKEGYQWVFDNDVLNVKGATLIYGGKEQVLNNTNYSYRGSELGKLGASRKGAIGEPGPEIGEFGYEGPYSATPENLTGFFPSPATLDLQGMDAASYSYIDPATFAQKFGELNRREYTKNFAEARKFGLDTLDTELEGLINYVPRSSQLIREQVSADNTFNQAERTRQVDAAMPGAREDLELMSSNARAMASGRLPSSIDDRALELGMRSDAADLANMSGFGARSSVARKTSDLMSAERRLDISKYGNQLIDAATRTKADVLMAPTSYSAAGQNIQVMPTQSAGQLTTAITGELNARTLISPDTTFSSDIGQSQFVTNVDQRTREFNKTMEYNTKTFNANVTNQFAMSLFDYMVSYANAVASGEQNELNTRMNVNMQQRATDAYGREKKRTQRNNTIKDVISTGVNIGRRFFGG